MGCRCGGDYPGEKPRSVTYTNTHDTKGRDEVSYYKASIDPY